MASLLTLTKIVAIFAKISYLIAYSFKLSRCLKNFNKLAKVYDILDSGSVYFAEVSKEFLEILCSRENFDMSLRVCMTFWKLQ